MEFKVQVGISNHHLHLTREVYDQLFDDEPNKVKDLKQTGEYATDKLVILKGPKGNIERVRLLGPFRAYNQVEISASDAFILGVNPPVRKSGDLAGSETITVIGDKGEVTLNEACIMAQCHIHMSLSDLEKYHVKNDQVVRVRINGEREGDMFAHIKATEKGILEFHVDRDEANAFLLQNNEELTVVDDL